jgi:hypothetical protein
MFNNELDMLECRLVELQGVPDLVHVIVEADVTHGGNTPKPLHYAENAERFAPWADRIVHVVASDLPTDVDAWSREHAQREHVGRALADADPYDIVFHGDVDEIPDPTVAAYIEPAGFVVMSQRLHCFAVDWLHPEPWAGTVAGRFKDITSFARMRDARLTTPRIIPNAGWHLSWLGGEEIADAKMWAFCHPEIIPQWEGRLGSCYRDGIHVDGTKMAPVTVDDTWPRWVAEKHCPTSWFRP